MSLLSRVLGLYGERLDFSFMLFPSALGSTSQTWSLCISNNIIDSFWPSFSKIYWFTGAYSSSCGFNDFSLFVNVFPFISFDNPLCTYRHVKGVVPLTSTAFFSIAIMPFLSLSNSKLIKAKENLLVWNNDAQMPS